MKADKNVVDKSIRGHTVDKLGSDDTHPVNGTTQSHPIDNNCNLDPGLSNQSNYAAYTQLLNKLSMSSLEVPISINKS